MAETSNPRARASASDGPPVISVLSVNQVARRDRIIDAGLALLDDRDYDRIQVKEIADEAGVALRTLDPSFPSQGRLFAGGAIRGGAPLRPPISRRPRPGGPPARPVPAALR